MTLLTTGIGLILSGIALAVYGAGEELQAINQALTRRMKASIALVLVGIGFVLVGLRLQGQIVFRRYARRFRASRLGQVAKSAFGRVRQGLRRAGDA